MERHDVGNPPETVGGRKPHTVHHSVVLSRVDFNDLTWNVLCTGEESVTHLRCISYNGAEVSPFCSAVRSSLSAISSSITAGLVH